MGHLLAIVTAVIMSPVPLLAQNGDKEQEVRRFLQEYDKAMLTRDIAFLESAEFIDQQVRVIDNNTAVETGKIRYIGTNAGTPFDLTKRYTTTWVFRGRWQIGRSYVPGETGLTAMSSTISVLKC